MTHHHIGTCRFCGADVVFVWSATDTHKRMTLDAKPEQRLILLNQYNRGYRTWPGDPDAGAQIVDTYVEHQCGSVR